MGEIFFTSDTHFAHDKNFIYLPREYNSVEEMNEDIVEKWNRLITPNDTVYHLGDVVLTNTEKGLEYAKRLNGHIHLIRGNHDTTERIFQITNFLRWEYLGYAAMFKFGKKNFYLSHYPTMTGNHEEKHAPWCLCGHTHTHDRFEHFDNRCYHVELDAHYNHPVSIDQILDDLNTRRCV